MSDLNEMVSVRYMVDDVEEAVVFYTNFLGFEVLTNFLAFADVARGKLRLLLSGPKSSAGRPMPDGTRPGPGGWNRIHLIVDDIDAEVARLRATGARFRNDIVEGPDAASRSCSRTPPAMSSNSFSPQPPSTRHDEENKMALQQPSAASITPNASLREWWSVITTLLLAAIFIEAVFAGAMLSGVRKLGTAHGTPGRCGNLDRSRSSRASPQSSRCAASRTD